MATTTDDKYLSFAGLKVFWDKIKDLVAKKQPLRKHLILRLYSP